MTTDPKVLDKIQKLLRLSKSPEPAEAALAAARAAELMVQYQISEEALHLADAEQPVGVFAVGDWEVLSVWKINLASGLSQALGCRSFNNLVKGSRQTQTAVIGRRSDVETFRYLYALLIREIDIMSRDAWSALVMVKGMPPGTAGERAALNKSWRDSYRLGVAEVIGERMAQQRTTVIDHHRQVGTGTALARIDRASKAVQDKATSIGITSTAIDKQVIGNGYHQGREDGNDVRLTNNSKTLGAGQARLPERTIP